MIVIGALVLMRRSCDTNRNLTETDKVLRVLLAYFVFTVPLVEWPQCVVKRISRYRQGDHFLLLYRCNHHDRGAGAHVHEVPAIREDQAACGLGENRPRVPLLPAVQSRPQKSWEIDLGAVAGLAFPLGFRQGGDLQCGPQMTTLSGPRL